MRLDRLAPLGAGIILAFLVVTGIVIVVNKGVAASDIEFIKMCDRLAAEPVDNQYCIRDGNIVFDRWGE